MLCGADTIPKQFQLVSGVRDHQFRLRRSQMYFDDSMRSWPFELLREGAFHHVAAPVEVFPSECEAMAIFSTVDGETEREGRYIRIHSAYEAVVAQRDVELSAVRHALAHPITKLTRPAVCSVLRKHFGDRKLDLAVYAHQKVLYTFAGKMLVAIDEALASVFLQRWGELDVLASNYAFERSEFR